MKMPSKKLHSLTLQQMNWKSKFFQTLGMLDVETSKIMKDVYNRNVKNRKKENYIEFYYKLRNILDDNEISVIEDNDNTSD